MVRKSKMHENYNKTYKEIEILYKTMSIKGACNEMNISVKTYYRICKTLNLPSVACNDYDLIKQDRQIGGNRLNNNIQNNNISSNNIIDAENEQCKANKSGRFISRPRYDPDARIAELERKYPKR